MPYIAQVALGKKPSLFIYGGDYATPDGTGTYYTINKYNYCQLAYSYCN